PTKRWKLSAMDLASWSKWQEYSRAKDEMFAATDTDDSPWWAVDGDVKRHARLNCIAHLLDRIPYEDLTPPPIDLPARPDGDAGHDRFPLHEQRFVPHRY